MRVAELTKLKEELKSADRDFLPGLGPLINVRVNNGYRRRSDYSGSVLKVVDVDVDGRKILVEAKDGQVWMSYKGLQRTDDALTIYYKGIPLAEYLDWEQNKDVVPEVFDHFGNQINIGDTVIWYKQGRWDGGMRSSTVEKITKNVHGNVTITMADGSKFGQDPKNLVVMPNTKKDSVRG